MGKRETFHICVPISRALEELKKGNNIFDGSPMQALHDLTQAQAEGKKYYSGCDNMNSEGQCGGHEVI